MVEEEFKIGLSIELEQDSLDAISRQVQKQINQSLGKAFRGAAGRGRAPAATPTVRSAAQASQVDASQISKAIRDAIATETSAFTRASEQVVKAVNELSAIMKGARPSAPAAPTTGRRARQLERNETVIRGAGRRIRGIREEADERGLTDELRKKLEREQKRIFRSIRRGQRIRQDSIRDSSKFEKAEADLARATQELAAARRKAAQQTSRGAAGPTGGAGVSGARPQPGAPPRRILEAERQQGPTNVRLGANIDTRRAAGSERTAGGGTGQKAALLGDAPKEKTGEQAFKTPTERVQGRRAERYQAGAQETVRQVSGSIRELVAAMRQQAPQAMTPELMKRIGLAGRVKVGEGAGATVERTGDRAKHIARTIEMVDGNLQRLSNVITDRIRQLTTTTGGQEQLAKLGRVARKDVGAFEAQARRMVSGVFEGLPPVEPGKPLAGVQKAGEAKAAVKVTGALQQRLSALEDEATIIAEVNKYLYEASSASAELRDQLRKLGIEAMTTAGLSESVAPRTEIIRGEGEGGRPGPVEEVRLPVQTRNLPALGLGGAGAMRAARIFQPHQLQELEGGGVPSVMGRGERELYQAGMYKPGAFKEAKTALVDPGMIPELFEDQMLFDPDLLKMPMKELRQQVVKGLGTGIQEGAQLTKGQVLGTRGEGEELEEVPFDMKGVRAEVKKIEETMIDGVKGYRIVIEEIGEAVTGMKMTERSGIKGVAKAVPGLAKKHGLPAGTAVAMSTSAVARRGSLRLPMEMMSNTIADATGASAQEIADRISAAMEEGGEEFASAVRKVAEQMGLKGFTGAEVVTKGPLAQAKGGKAAVMTGKVAFGRLPKMGMEGEMPIEPRYFGAADVEGLKMGKGTAQIAADMQKVLSQLTDNFAELSAQLRNLAGDSDAATAGLKEIRPEQLKRLPQAAAAPGDLKGTLLDPEMKEAMAMRIPTREGGERRLRVPKVGGVAGERDLYRTDVGTVGAGPITRLMDQIAEQATKARAAMGKAPITDNAQALEEAAEITSQALSNQIAEIRKLGIETDEGAAAAQEFVSKFMPVVEALGQGPAGIKFEGRGGKVFDVKRSASDYVKYLDEQKQRKRPMEQQLFAMQDVLGKRAAGKGKVPSLGAVFKDVEALQSVMNELGVTLSADSEAAGKALTRLEQLEEQLMALFAETALTRVKPSAAKGRSLAQAREAGAGFAPYGAALEFPTDVSRELEAVAARLTQMRDAGQNVDEALMALERMRALGEAQGGIPRDAVLINQKDWQNLVQATSKRLKISPEEAGQRLKRPGLLHRYPTTGPRSFLPAKPRVVGEETMPAGALGVPGPMPVSSPEDLSAMLAPLRQLKDMKLGNLRDLMASGEGASAAAEELRGDIDQLQGEIDALTPSYREHAMNLDFDGDHITFHADVARKAASELENFVAAAQSSSANMQELFSKIEGETLSKGGMGGMGEYSKLFGKVVKGRTPDLQKAVLRPDTPDVAAFEAHAHIAGKKSVGLLTDMFNRMMLSVRAGSDQVGDAFETFVGAIMLGINKSLAQKHGGGGVSGPTEFLGALRKGQLGKIKEGLEGGEGFLGELGTMSKQMQEQMRGRLTTMAAGPGGAERLRGFAAKEGIEKVLPEDLSGANLLSAVESMVDELDIYNVIVRMFDMMKENMRKALVKQGMTAGEATKEIQKALTPQGKAGFIKGIDQKAIMESFFPGYAATRKSMAEDLKEIPAVERIRRALEMLPQQIQEQVEADLMAADPGDELDPQQSARFLSQGLSRWFESIADTLKVVSREQMKKLVGFPAKGAYVYKRGRPAEGQVVAREDQLQKFQESLRTLGQIAEGTVTPAELGADALNEMRKGLKEFVETMGHENVHKYAKQWQTAVSRIVQSLRSGTGALARGGPGGAAIGRFIEKVPNVRQKFERYKAGQVALETGRAAELPTARGGTERVEGITQARVQELMSEFEHTLAEEMLAYQFNPEKFARLTGEGGEQIKGFLEKQLQSLIKARPEILDATRNAARVLNSSYVEGLLEAAEGTGPGAGDVRGQVKDLVGSRLDFAGRGKFIAGQEKLGAFEEALMSGTQLHGLAPLRRGARGVEKLGDVPKIPLADRPELRGVAEEIEEIQNAIARSIPDPQEFQDMRRRLMRAGYKARATYSKLEKAGEISGISGHFEFVKIHQQFWSSYTENMMRGARDLQRQIAEMEQAGQVDTPEFGQLLDKFNRQIQEIAQSIESSGEIFGRGAGTRASPFFTKQGELLPELRGQGVDTGRPENIQAALRGVAGEGDEASSFMQRLGGHLEEAVATVREGGDQTQVWSSLIRQMLQYPDEMKVDLQKVTEFLRKSSSMVGPMSGKFGKAAQSLKEMGDDANRVAAALKGVKPEDIGQVLATTMTGTKQQRGALGRGMGVEQQYANIEQAVEARRKQLEKISQLPSYKALGAAGKQFEPMQFEVTDELGKPVQKITANFKRMGNTIKSSMEQGGAAVRGFGMQMKNALRRVVQWGFASGIIYGMIRAFRDLVRTVTEVETKIANLRKVMDTTTTNFERMQEGAAGFAREFGVSIEEVLDGMVVYGQQGLEMNKIMERTRATMLAVNVTTLKAEEATEAITAVMKLFTNEVGSAEKAVDAWAAVAAKHAITAKDLALAVQRSGAAAKTAGVDYNDFLGIVTSIGAVTRRTGKEIATGTKFMFRAMRRPKAQKQLLGLGIETQDVTGDLRPAMDVLGELAAKWDELNKAQQLTTAQSMAGIRHYNKFVVLMENFEEVLDASADAANSQGFAVRKNQEAMKTFNKRMQVFRETVKGFALDVGKAILPAMTSIMTVLGKAIGVLEGMPDAFKTAAVAAGAFMVTFHKGAEIVTDTLDALMGYGGAEAGLGMMERIKKGGGMRAVPGMMGRSLKGAFRGTGKVAMAGDIAQMVDASDELGLVARKLLGVRKAASAAAAGFKALSTGMKALAVTGVGALIAVLGALAYSFSQVGKSGKEVEDDLYNSIGRTMDQVDALNTQSKHLRSVSHAWDKYASAVRAAQDPAKLKEDIRGGTFKGPLVALKEYEDRVYETGEALAALRPESIEGISETGEYIYEAGAAMEYLTSTAADAKKATAAAMQTKVIEAYSKELTEARSGWDKFLGMLGKDVTLVEQLENARDQINKLVVEREKLAAEGIAPVGIQEEMNKAVERELELRGEAAAIVGNMKRILDQMPTFESGEIARQVYTGERMRTAIGAGADAGQFGREATTGGVALSYIARSLGLGGQIGFESTASAGRLQQRFMEQGMRARRGPATGAGEVGFISAEQARTLMEEAAGPAAAGAPAQAIERARTLITGMDQATGELLYYFENAVEGTVEVVRESQMGEELRQAVSDMLIVDRSEIATAAEKTKKLLNVQATGVLAGIRMPKEGLPDIGPARFREMSVEQRIMQSLPDEMNQLAEAMANLEHIQDNYNEALGESGDNAAMSAAQIEKNFNVLDANTKEMVKSMQKEIFKLTELAHVEKAFQTLKMTLEEAAVAARDAAIEEQARFELLEHTTGALAGMPIVGEPDLGKRLKELSPIESLQRDLGEGFSRALSEYSRQQQSVERGVETTINIRKQLADFNEMIRDLATAEGELTKQQEAAFKAQLEGTTKGEQLMMDTIQEQTGALVSSLEEQTPMLDKMVSVLETIAQINAEGSAEQKKEALKKGLARVEGKELAQFAGQVSPEALSNMIMGTLGISKRTEDPGMFMPKFYQQREGVAGGVGEEFRGRFQEIADKYYEQLEQEAALRRTGREAGHPALKRSEQARAELAEELLAIPEIAAKFRKHFETMAEREAAAAARPGATGEPVVDKRAQLLEKLQKRKAEVLQNFADAEKNTIADLAKSQDVLQRAGAQLSMAEAAQGLALGIETIIDDFKKAEMLHYEKIDSDLEGPFARVGKPGFKTDFERRREELEDKYRGPMSMQEMRQRNKELADIEFEEKEARIKQQQDEETAALRQQQQQADKLREAIATALVGGELEGTGMERRARNYMDTLTQQLAESEQAEMRGGELRFKGVPGIEDALRFVKQLKTEAKERAQQAQKQLMAEAHQQALNPVVQAQNTANQHLNQIVKNTAAMAQGAAGAGAAPVAPQLAGAAYARGLPATGAGALPQAVTPSQRRAAQTAGMAPVAGGRTGLADVFRTPSGDTGMYDRLTGDLMEAMRQATAQEAAMAPQLGPMRERAGGTRIYGETFQERFQRGPAEQAPRRFVEEQTIGVKRQVEGALTGLEKMKGIMDQLSKPGTRVFQPTGAAKKGPLSFTNVPGSSMEGARDIRDMYHGPSNYNQITRMKTRSQYGNATAASTATVSTRTQGGRDRDPGPAIPNTERDITRRGAGGAAQTEALQGLADSFAGLQEVLGQLASQGVQLPSDFSSTISDLGTTIADALADTLTVEVSNTPLEVSIPDLSSSFSDAIEGSSLSSVGADVSDALGRVAVLESVVDPDTGQTVEERIEAALSDINTEEIETNVAGLTERVETIEPQIESLQELEGLDTTVSDLQTLLDETIESVDTNTSNIETIDSRIETVEGNITEFSEVITEFGDRIDTTETNISEFGTRIDSFESDSIQPLEANVDQLSTTVENAVAEVDELRDSLTALTNEVSTNRTDLETQVRDRSSEINRISTSLTETNRNVSEVRGKAESALSTAQQALNTARQKR